MSEEIVNRVAQSALVNLDLADWYPKEEVLVFDLKLYLFMDAILKEKEFRASLQAIDWTGYRDKIVAVTCTADAIIPLWAFMLVAVSLEPYAKAVVMGDRDEALRQIFLSRIASIDINEYAGKRVIVKGCGDQPIGGYAYLEIARRLRPVARSIMYGEACSNVPVYKAKN